MNLFHSQEVLGLDIGTRVVKAVVMAKRKGKVEVHGASMAAIESFNKEDRNEKILEALKKVLAELGNKPRRVGLACSGHDVFQRRVKLPPVTKGKLKQIVQYETQQQIPFSLDEVIWDYHILTTGAKAEMNALILAVKKEIVNETLNLISPLKLTAELLDFTPVSVYNTLWFNNDISPEVPLAIIDMGAQSIEIIIVEAGEIAMIRTIPLGGDSFTNAIAQGYGIDFEKAREIKEKEDVVKNEKMSLIIQPVLEKIMDEIRRSIGYYRSQLRGQAIQDLVLTGGGTRLKDMESYLEENLGIKIKKINPFSKVTLSTDISFRFPEPSIFSVAMGLGLRLLEEGSIKVNLLPEPLLQKIEIRKKEPVFIISFVLALLTFLVYCGIVRQRAFKEESILKQMKETIEGYSELEGTLRPKLEEKKKLLDRISRFEAITGEKTFWLDILNEVACLMPDTIVIEDFFHLTEEIKKVEGVTARRPGVQTKREESAISEGIRIEGLSPDYNTVSDFMESLGASPMIEKVDIDNSSTGPIETEKGEMIRFVLIAGIKK